MGETALPVVVPHLYLDTMIMVDTLFDRVRGDDSIELVEAIRNRRWYCSTSNFAVMELLDQWQEEQWVGDQRREGLQFRAIYRGLPSRRTDPNKLKRIYDQIMRRLEIRYPFIRYAYPNDAGWAEAARICGITDIDASDCIHIVTAREAGCDLFVTKDADLIGRLSSQLPNYIQVARPGEVDQKLRGLGFRWRPGSSSNLLQRSYLNRRLTQEGRAMQIGTHFRELPTASPYAAASQATNVPEKGRPPWQQRTR